ncbi:hypothetical protein [Smaragdicoccus niigatensis]|uniref:hypothetical protein n=1 Tax=Smaragdicoccus niigatensis TaxID=359359 RepID=UPI00037BA5E2|nr:hypothetical protein [Smaragdicoccus niigatensis]
MSVGIARRRAELDRTVVLRGLLGLVGVGAIAFGVMSALDRPIADLLSAAIWFGGGIALHDGVFAPICLAVWFLVLRRLPVWVSVCGFLSVVLMVLAIPVLPREKSLPNPTVLDRNYVLGVGVALAIVWTAGIVVQLIRSMLNLKRRAVLATGTSAH